MRGCRPRARSPWLQARIATFPVTTVVTVPTAVTITATYSGVVKTATLTVNPAARQLCSA